MNRYLLLFLLVLATMGCKSKKVSLKGDDSVDITEFIQFFPEMKLPFSITDLQLQKPVSDSFQISRKIFLDFIPDSVITKSFGRNGHPRIYALGRAHEPGGDDYLLIKAEAGTRRLAWLICFNGKQAFEGSLPVIEPGGEYRRSTCTLDDKFQITIYKEGPRSPGRSAYRKEVYIHSAGSQGFPLILTEPNEEIISEVINPIDSLPRHHKYSGDYVQNKKNFVSIRDGRNNSELQFFVHFERDNGSCTGELKGRARFVKPAVAIYQETGNPCELQLSFSSGSVSLKELGGCGTYRGITCFFEGKYPRKKEPRKKTGRTGKK